MLRMRSNNTRADCVIIVAVVVVVGAAGNAAGIR